MVTVRKLESVVMSKDLIEVACLSTDTKPTEDIANGSVLIEMDTKKVYMFDGDNALWREI